MDLSKVGMTVLGSGIVFGHRDLKPTIDELPSYHLYMSNWVSGVKIKGLYSKKANSNILPL